MSGRGSRSGAGEGVGVERERGIGTWRDEYSTVGEEGE